MTSVWWHNGKPLDDPRIPLDAPLARWGDGVFETVRVDGGRARWLELHLDRLTASAAAHLLALPDVALLRRWVEHASLGFDSGALRLVATPGASGSAAEVYVGVTHLPGGDPPPVTLSVVDVPHPGLAEFGKNTSWSWSRIALRYALARGADDALLVDGARVVESATAAVAFRCGNSWSVCGEAEGALASTTVRALRTAIAVDARTVPVDELVRADAVVLLSSLRLATPVRRIDGATLKDARADAAALRTILLSIA